MFVRRVLAIAFLAASVSPLSEAQEPVRVFVSDGETWEIAGASQGFTAFNGGNFETGAFGFGARPQQVEMMKTIGHLERPTPIRTS